MKQKLMKRRVLIIDDDEIVRESISRVLEGVGYEVTACPNGTEATVRFAEEETALVLLDLNLPRESGWEVFERLTTLRPLVPVIIITGLADQYGTALAAGVSGLIEKPIEVSVLLGMIDELLTEPGAERLRRLCGHQSKARHVQPSIPWARQNSARADRSQRPLHQLARRTDRNNVKGEV